ARCAGTADSPTVITCAFAGLPGGLWQTGTLIAAATRGMAAMAANTNNAAHIVRVFGSGCRGSIVMSGLLGDPVGTAAVRLAARSREAICRPHHGVGAIARSTSAHRWGAQARALPCSGD